MKILKSLFFLGYLLVLVCVFESKDPAWGENIQKGEEILTDQEVLETVCNYATAPLEKILASEIEKNAEVYFLNGPEVGQYFIERNINILEQLQAHKFGFVPQKARKWDLAFNYGWYGKVLRIIGKPDEAQLYFVKALRISKDAGGKFTSQEELLEFLERLEKSHLKHSRSKELNSAKPIPIPNIGFEE